VAFFRLERHRGQHPADDQLGQRRGDLAVSLKVGLNVLAHREGHVGMADALAERSPVDLGIAAGGGVAVPDE
jgi:hypothetical protein